MEGKVIHTTRSFFLGLGALLVALSGCAGKNADSGKQTGPAHTAVTCIAVLPASSTVDYDGSLNFEQASVLKQGVKNMDDILLAKLGQNKQTRFISIDQLYALRDYLPAESLSVARLVGKHLSCNVALETTLSKYVERQGGKYSVEQPASVNFHYRLLALESGEVLCRGEFKEEQKSVLENILSFHKARQRGFSWVNGKELLEEGVDELFEKCSYLHAE